jgi:hypothetical protein
MADLSLVTANEINVVESFEQATIKTEETVHPGQVGRFVTSTGLATKSNASSAAEAAAYGLATGKVANVAGMPVTFIRKGVVDGFDLSGLNYWAPVYISMTDGALTDADPDVYGESILVGRVIPASAVNLGTAFDKLLLVDFPL